MLDLSSPFADAALPGGERLPVAIPDVTRTDRANNIRKYVVRAGHLDDLVALGSLTRSRPASSPPPSPQASTCSSPGLRKPE